MKRASVQYLDGVVAGVGEPYRSDCVLEEGTQQRRSGRAATGRMQSSNAAYEVQRVERGAPADDRGRVLRVDERMQVVRDERVETVDACPEILVGHGRYRARARSIAHTVLAVAATDCQRLRRADGLRRAANQRPKCR